MLEHLKRKHPGQLDSHWIPLCRLVWRDLTNLFDERQTRYVVKLLMWLGCVTPKVGSASTFLPQSAALFLRTPVWHAPLQPNWNSLNKMNWKTIIINHNKHCCPTCWTTMLIMVPSFYKVQISTSGLDSLILGCWNVMANVLCKTRRRRKNGEVKWEMVQ